MTPTRRNLEARSCGGLHGPIWHPDRPAALDALLGEPGILRVELNAQPVPAVPLGHHRDGAGPEERVEHYTRQSSLVAAAAWADPDTVANDLVARGVAADEVIPPGPNDPSDSPLGGSRLPRRSADDADPCWTGGEERPTYQLGWEGGEMRSLEAVRGDRPDVAGVLAERVAG